MKIPDIFLDYTTSTFNKHWSSTDQVLDKSVSRYWTRTEQVMDKYQASIRHVMNHLQTSIEQILRG